MIIWMKFRLYTNNALQILHWFGWNSGSIATMKFRLYTNNALQILHWFARISGSIATMKFRFYADLDEFQAL
jgi:CRISPR/Cas system CMR-associated protein Cmr5 small subunit